MSEKQHFILVASDTSNLSGEVVRAHEIAVSRLKAGLWPIYRGTRNRHACREGDLCLIYLAGGGQLSQHFVWQATVSEVILFGRKDKTVDPPEYVTDMPVSAIALRDIKPLRHPVSMRRILHSLDFVPNNSAKWGSALQGGFRKISNSDFLKIFERQNALPAAEIGDR